MTLSAVILTLNEERNLPGALEALRDLCDDIVVFDSFSSDATCTIASSAGARVIQRRFDNYAAQRNAALSVPYKHEWIFMLDADERVSVELWKEMVAEIRRSSASTSMFRVRRKDIFFGRWLRRSSGYPTWFGRLMRIGKTRVEREINEEYVTDGEIGYLREHLVHFPFNRGISHWLDRHNQYSSLEASRLREERQLRIRVGDFFAKDPTARRKALKLLAYRLPLRPTLVFVYLYLIRGGFLDGRPGFWYCKLRAFYEFQIDLKIAESIVIPPR